MDLREELVGNVTKLDINMFTTNLHLGIILIIFIFFLMLVEIGLCIVTNPAFAYSPIQGKGEDIGPESRIYNERALVFAGLIFAGITLLVDSSKEDLNKIQASLIVLTYSLSLFFISYKIEVLTGLKRIWWIVQEKTLNYGFITMIAGLVTFFYEKLQGLLIIGIVLFIIIYTTHLIELYYDLGYYESRKKRLETNLVEYDGDY